MGCNNPKNVVQPMGRPSSSVSRVVQPMDRPSSSVSITSTPTRADHSPEPDQRAKTDEELFADHILMEHNKYRKIHRVGDLSLNAEMSEIAQRWAQHLADINKMEHSSEKFRAYRDWTLGENLAYQYSSDKSLVGNESVGGWYDEIKLYNFNKGGFSKQCGHFTQVVWKGSQELGVGRAFTDGGRTVYVVCNYYPPGNVSGQFDENVSRV